tara:strand:- start:5079 stop:6113 length:1035 start_codon:yes stop_codon:yes gene_type:complete
MNSREKILAALSLRNTGRPPLWVMRQAGRYLPEYRALKEKYNFLKMVKTPELAMEVTLQPLKRFDLDAAILFSDILVIPEAMGQSYHFREKGGIQMEFSADSREKFNHLHTANVQETLSYVPQALSLLRKELGDDKALLGFCGSPWTLACYMIDGGSSTGFPKTCMMAREDPLLLGDFLQKISSALIEYIKMQRNAGIDALQIFDSWHSLCPLENAWEWSLRWIKEIVQAIPNDLSIILYAKAKSERFKLLAETGVNCLSLDHQVDLFESRCALPSRLSLQGNLDPDLMESNAESVARETNNLLSKMNGDSGHILNLGHGIRPGAKIECMETLVETNQNFNYSL